jgi:hypothetical protein
LLILLVLILLVVGGARYVRRLARQRPGPTGAPQDDWYRKPLVQQPEPDDEP